MADTKRLEMVAEDLISSVLQQSGILVAKPKFDERGSDLFAMNSVEEPIRLCRIQCKGRSFRNSARTSIRIPRRYVSPSFVVFLYVDGSKVGRYHLYCFFVDDLKREPWKEHNEEHVLSVGRSTFQEKLKHYALDATMINKVRDVINRASASEELRYVFESQGLLRGQGSTPGQDIRIENVGGRSVPIIRDRASKTERTGTECPGNPNDFDYDASTDRWTAK